MKNIEATAIGRGRSARRWPMIIVGLLVGHVALMMAACVIATHDKSFVVVPNYYGRAVNWDREMAARRASKALGWHVVVEASGHVDASGRRGVSFVLSDADGRPVKDATLEADYFHHAHPEAERVVKLEADPREPGRYPALLSMPYAGTYEFHFSAIGQGKTFTESSIEILSNDGKGVRL